MNGLKFFFLLIMGVMMLACTQEKKEVPVITSAPSIRLEDASGSIDSARAIIRSSMERHGGARYQDLDIQFVFRKQAFRATRQNGLFTYSRAFADSTGNAIRDVLSNDLFSGKLTAQERF